jgi:hypothetical protein
MSNLIYQSKISNLFYSYSQKHSSSTVKLSRFTNQALGLAQYALRFLKSLLKNTYYLIKSQNLTFLPK